MMNMQREAMPRAGTDTRAAILRMAVAKMAKPTPINNHLPLAHHNSLVNLSMDKSHT